MLESKRMKLVTAMVNSHDLSSRRPFTPPDHWLVTSQVDMVSFIDAAVYVSMFDCDISVQLLSRHYRSERKRGRSKTGREPSPALARSQSVRSPTSPLASVYCTTFRSLFHSRSEWPSSGISSRTTGGAEESRRSDATRRRGSRCGGVRLRRMALTSYRMPI